MNKMYFDESGKHTTITKNTATVFASSSKSPAKLVANPFFRNPEALQNHATEQNQEHDSQESNEIAENIHWMENDAVTEEENSDENKEKKKE